MAKFLLSAFADEIDPNFDIQMSEMKRHGIEYFELRGIDGASISTYDETAAAALKARMDAAGFKTSALGTPCGKQRIDEDFGPHFDMFKRMLDVADVLEVPYLRMFSFFVPQEEPERYKAEVMRRLSEMAKAAQSRKVQLVHENEKHIYGDVTERCLEIAREFPEIIKVTFDPSNFVQCGVNTMEAYEALRPYIVYMHIKDSVNTGKAAEAVTGIDVRADGHRPAGLGEGNVQWILQKLWDSGFEGFLSIEPHLSRYAAVEGGGIEKFACATDALKGLLKTVTGKNW